MYFVNDDDPHIGLGRREPIRLGDVQNFHGFESLTDMTDAIRNGTYDRSAFIDRYTRLGMDPAYAERAWRMASGWTESEWKAVRKFKTTRHPHTNMAKAALNMMTRTSAADYHQDGIHMNAVDTGWITDGLVNSMAPRLTT